MTVSKSIETRSRAIEDKQNEFADEISKNVLTLRKRLYMTYNLVAKNLIHAFYMQPGPVSDDAVAEVRKLIDQEVEKMREVFKDE